MIVQGVPAGFTQHAEQTLSASEIELVQKMMQRLDKKRGRNIIRQQYYDQNRPEGFRYLNAALAEEHQQRIGLASENR